MPMEAHPMSGIPEDIVVAEQASIEEVFHKLNANKKGIVFVVDDARRVIGCLTDGDIRRQLLVQNDLSVSISTFANRQFVHASANAPREHILKLLDNAIHVVPLLDAQGRLVKICSRDEFHLQDEGEMFARARAPARISFGGGGTDLTHFFFEQGGVVINATIAKYAHATLRWRTDGRIHVYSHDLQARVEAGNMSELKLDGEMGLINSVISLIKPRAGFDLEVSSDFPVGSGLGGSAAVTAAIIGCFNEFRTDPWTRHQIAEMAFQSERLIFKIAGGWQDQYATTFGGFNFMEFSADENVIVPLRLESRTLRELEACFLLCHTGKAHHSGAIHADQKNQMRASPGAASAAGRQKDITAEMHRLLLRGEVHRYGRLLHDAWQAKRQFSSLISDSETDRIYDHAVANGAEGGKLLGAGGGGYFLFYVPPFSRYRLLNALKAIGYDCERLILDDGGLQSWKMRVPAAANSSTKAADADMLVI
ncbi:MAG TPA: CBS domain-containing protein [Rhizomicrobium sp.]|jgi:D-glycero-alpha-D-manno-heptose-7-phosphate kinase|nr:CBS domain-containing protein [Rhizomicrobium sp.]